MNLLTVYFGFHPPAGLTELRSGASFRAIFGHVEAWGFTEDRTWMFFDPRGAGTRIRITHHHDDVTELMARRFEVCQTILKIAPTGREYRLPLFPPMNCATQCAHLVGLRAFTPAGLRRTLLANGAETIYAAERGHRGEEGPGTGTPDGEIREPAGCAGNGV